MLKWTASGAVSDPTTVQIRVVPAFPGRLAAGAPVPQRALTHAELRSNLHHFAVARRGPRTVACDTVVLSGVGGLDPDSLAPLVDEATSWGVVRWVVHVGEGTDALLAALAGRVHTVVRVVRDGGAPLGGVPGARLHLAIPLRAAVLARLPAIVERVIATQPALAVLTWPYPGGDPPPAAEECGPPTAAALRALADAGVPCGLKGLPLCALPAAGTARWTWRSRNRWYVDAEHQLDGALLFHPRVVHLSRRDSCRFCAVTHRCDGVPAPWLDAGLAGALTPLSTA